MNKKIISVLFTFILCICMSLPVLAADNGFAGENDRVQDFFGVISQEDRDYLNNLYDEIAERQCVDVIICFTDSLDGMTTSEYAENLYEENNYGYGENKDGVMLLVSFEDSDWYIATRGYGITAFTKSGIQYVGNQIKGDLSDGDYAEAAEYFARLCDELLTDAKNGTPYNESFGAIDDGDTGTGSVLPPPMWILISIAVGVITALIVVGIMKSKLKTVKIQASANNYLKNGSLNITDSSDIFLYSNVTRTAKPKNNDNDSSTHESSSGNTYGGGGGKF